MGRRRHTQPHSLLHLWLCLWYLGSPGQSPASLARDPHCVSPKPGTYLGIFWIQSWSSLNSLPCTRGSARPPSASTRACAGRGGAPRLNSHRPPHKGLDSWLLSWARGASAASPASRDDDSLRIIVRTRHQLRPSAQQVSKEHVLRTSHPPGSPYHSPAQGLTMAPMSPHVVWRLFFAISAEPD